MTDVTFVLAMPGWEVLYYFNGGRFEAAPIVAWGLVAGDDGFVRASPVTTDLAWSVEDTERTICTPDGDVTCGELERWETVWEWIAAMAKREIEEPGTLPTARPPVTVDGSAMPLVPDNYRRKFQQPQEDVS